MYLAKESLDLLICPGVIVLPPPGTCVPGCPPPVVPPPGFGGTCLLNPLKKLPIAGPIPNVADMPAPMAPMTENIPPVMTSIKLPKPSIALPTSPARF